MPGGALKKDKSVPCNVNVHAGRTGCVRPASVKAEQDEPRNANPGRILTVMNALLRLQTVKIHLKPMQMAAYELYGGGCTASVLLGGRHPEAPRALLDTLHLEYGSSRTC